MAVSLKTNRCQTRARHVPDTNVAVFLWSRRSQDSLSKPVLGQRNRIRVSLARLCPHRASFCLTGHKTLDQPAGKKRMSFRAYASKNPGVWGWPQRALMAQHKCNGNRKFTIFAIPLLPNIKTVAAPGLVPKLPSQRPSGDRSRRWHHPRPRHTNPQSHQPRPRHPTSDP